MNFKQFYFLRESPDIVYNNEQQQLKWDAKDARSFGWLKVIPGVSPFLVYTKQDGTTHFELVDMILELLKFAKKTNTKQIKRDYEQYYNHVIETKPSFNELIDSLFLNKAVWSSILAGKPEKLYNKQISKIIDLDGNKPITTQMNERQIAFADSGRIWLKSKIISFWLTSVSLDIVNQIFDCYNVPVTERKTYLIDLIDVSNLEKEETKEKHLPTIEEYFQKTSSINKITKDQEKKLAELLAKRHTESDPIKKKQLQKELEKLDSTNSFTPSEITRTIPLKIRQSLTTSE